MKTKKQLGFSLVEGLLILVIIGLVGFIGWFIYNAKNSAAKSLDTSSKVSNTQPAKAQTINSFYSCWQAVGSVTQTIPSTCVYNGKSYTSPSKFDKEQILNLGKVPAAIAGPVITAAQAAFNKCLGSGLPAQQAQIVVVQDNYVDMALGCSPSFHQFFGAEHNIWSDLGTGQAGISCETVDKYKVRLASVDAAYKSTYANCSDSNGQSKKLPY